MISISFDFKVKLFLICITHWGWVTFIYVGKLNTIGWDNGLSPGWRQAIISTNAGILSIGHLGTNFSEILIGIQIFSFKEMPLKVSSVKWRPICLGLHVIINHTSGTYVIHRVVQRTAVGSCTDWGSVGLGTHHRSDTGIAPVLAKTDTTRIPRTPMYNYIMTSSNGNIFRVTGPLCREFTGNRWIPPTKASDSDLWCSLWSAPLQTVV